MALTFSELLERAEDLLADGPRCDSDYGKAAAAHALANSVLILLIETLDVLADED